MALAGCIAAITVAVAPAQADESGCKTSSAGSSSVLSGVVCANVRADGVAVTTTNNSFWRNTTAQTVCDRRAWNSGATTINGSWSTTSSLVPGCVTYYSEITLYIYRTVYNPSYYYSQFYANGSWVPAVPRMLMTTGCC